MKKKKLDLVFNFVLMPILILCVIVIIANYCSTKAHFMFEDLKTSYAAWKMGNPNSDTHDEKVILWLPQSMMNELQMRDGMTFKQIADKDFSNIMILFGVIELTTYNNATTHLNKELEKKTLSRKDYDDAWRGLDFGVVKYPFHSNREDFGPYKWFFSSLLDNGVVKVSNTSQVYINMSTEDQARVIATFHNYHQYYSNSYMNTLYILGEYQDNLISN